MILSTHLRLAEGCSSYWAFWRRWRRGTFSSCAQNRSHCLSSTWTPWKAAQSGSFLLLFALALELVFDHASLASLSIICRPRLASSFGTGVFFRNLYATFEGQPCWNRGSNWTYLSQRLAADFFILAYQMIDGVPCLLFSNFYFW